MARISLESGFARANHFHPLPLDKIVFLGEQSYRLGLVVFHYENS